MKKAIVPLVGVCLLMSAAIILYEGAAHKYKKYPTAQELTEEQPLSLLEVQKMDVRVQTNVDYSLFYRVQKITDCPGTLIRTKLDTIGVVMQAKPASGYSGKPNMPHYFSYYKLRI